MQYLGKKVSPGESKNGVFTPDDLVIGQHGDSTASFASATNFMDGTVVGSTILAPHINYILFPIYLATFAYYSTMPERLSFLHPPVLHSLV